VPPELQPLPAFLEKAIQLYEMIVVRHGLMLVGWSFGMKTAAIRVLAAALGDMCAAGQVGDVLYTGLQPVWWHAISVAKRCAAI
jgi:hypothetical protein